ncbi:MAG: hypothetical protein AVDCRST_MAG05-2151 [uncultured Rubrobacteraceae bacterium]|uniref:Uncharacterized protein n=1 Tax=uncultured Rubrobacteraceae bacterium TaxID=349277 RepID=A0A6J4SDT2_9ACTN|nr:MAG: hypothetical protein AVDCRST_MAG05-2151 [uncultured Rubrobacteraceae bacterium]
MFPPFSCCSSRSAVWPRPGAPASGGDDAGPRSKGGEARPVRRGVRRPPGTRSASAYRRSRPCRAR